MSIRLFGTREIDTAAGVILTQVFYNEERENYSYDFCLKPSPLGISADTYPDAQSAFAAAELAAREYQHEV